MSSTIDFYRVAEGWNVPLIDLDRIEPQPRGNPATPVERAYSITGKVHDDGLFMELNWDYIEEEQEYIDLLVLFGLQTNPSNEVTIYGRTKIFGFARYNGIAQQPEGMSEAKRSNFFIRDVTIRITHLELSA